MRRITVLSGLSGLILVFGVVLAFVAMGLVGSLLPDLGEQAGFGFGIVLLAISCAGAGAIWGRTISAITGSGGARQIATVSASTYAFAVIAAIALLGMLEPIVVEQGRLNLPIHIAFAVLFVPATALVCGLVSAAIGIAVGNARLSRQLAWRGGLAGGLAFLALDGIQDALGRRVGGPDAAETATMLTVTLVGMLGAAIAASATIGYTLAAWRGQAVGPATAAEAA